MSKKSTPDDVPYFGVGIRLTRRAVVRALKKQKREIERRMAERKRIVIRLKQKRARLPKSAAFRVKRNDRIQMRTLQVDAFKEIDAEILVLGRENMNEEGIAKSLGLIVEHLDDRPSFLVGLGDLQRLNLLGLDNLRRLDLTPGLLS